METWFWLTLWQEYGMHWLFYYLGWCFCKMCLHNAKFTATCYEFVACKSNSPCFIGKIPSLAPFPWCPKLGIWQNCFESLWLHLITCDMWFKLLLTQPVIWCWNWQLQCSLLVCCHYFCGGAVLPQIICTFEAGVRICFPIGNKQRGTSTQWATCFSRTSKDWLF